MSTTDKIASTDEAWDSGALGASMAHTKAAPMDLDAAIDTSLGMQMISIRLPKELVQAYKLIAAHHGVGYQPLMRDILQRFVPEGLNEVLAAHIHRTQEVDSRLAETRKAA